MAALSKTLEIHVNKTMHNFLTSFRELDQIWEVITMFDCFLAFLSQALARCSTNVHVSRTALIVSVKLLMTEVQSL